MERSSQWSSTGISFGTYINDLYFGIRNWILKFADDTKVFSKVSTSYEQYQLQEDINKLIEWSRRVADMLFSIGKCKIKHFGRTNSLTEYNMNNQKLETVTEEKDLGVIISQDLKASQQAYNKARRILGMINRNIVYRSKDIMVPLYKSLVRPHLEYCTAAWSHTIKTINIYWKESKGASQK